MVSVSLTQGCFVPETMKKKKNFKMSSMYIFRFLTIDLFEQN